MQLLSLSSKIIAGVGWMDGCRTVFLGVFDEVVGFVDVVLQFAVVPLQAHQVQVHVLQAVEDVYGRVVGLRRLHLRGLDLPCQICNHPQSKNVKQKKNVHMRGNLT